MPVKKEQNSVAAQIDWLKGNPVTKDDRPIKRMIYIAPHLVNFKKEIEQWKWKLDTKKNAILMNQFPSWMMRWRQCGMVWKVGERNGHTITM